MATTFPRRHDLSVVDSRKTRPDISLGKAAYWVSAPLAAVAATAAAFTAFAPGLLRGTAVMNGSARGTALVVLLVAVPALVVSMVAASRGSARAVIVWLGAAAYLTYNSVLFLFATPFNELFLLYVPMLSLSIWSTVAVLHAIHVPSFAGRYSPRLPARPIAVYLMAIAALNTLAWLRVVVPASMSGGAPSFLDGTGLTTNPVFVQDLAIWLPLMAVAAIWLWRRTAWGYVISGLLLVTYVIEGIGVAMDQWLGHLADPASSVVSVAAVPMFLVLAVAGMVPLFFHLRHLDRAGKPQVD